MAGAGGWRVPAAVGSWPVSVRMVATTWGCCGTSHHTRPVECRWPPPHRTAGATSRGETRQSRTGVAPLDALDERRPCLVTDRFFWGQGEFPEPIESQTVPVKFPVADATGSRTPVGIRWCSSRRWTLMKPRSGMVTVSGTCGGWPVTPLTIRTGSGRCRRRTVTTWCRARHRLPRREWRRPGDLGQFNSERYRAVL